MIEPKPKFDVTNLGHLTVTVGTAALLGCLLYLISRPNSPPEVEKKSPKINRQKKPINPQWAITKAKELQPPIISEEQITALNRRRPPNIWNNVIIFPDLIPNNSTPTDQLLQYFRDAKSSIDLCMYLCSFRDMSDVIQDKYREGLMVQVITDYDTWTAHNNKGIKSFAKRGIPVKIKVGNGSLMHNKFAIIDEEVAITGSLNWTRQGSMTNNENVLVTTDPRITKKYLTEFNKLWRESQDSSEVDG